MHSCRKDTEQREGPLESIRSSLDRELVGLEMGEFRGERVQATRDLERSSSRTSVSRAFTSPSTYPSGEGLRDLVEVSRMGHPWTHVQANRQAAVGSHRRAVRAEWADAEAVRPAARAAAEYRAVVDLPEQAPGEQEP